MLWYLIHFIFWLIVLFDLFIITLLPSILSQSKTKNNPLNWLAFASVVLPALIVTLITSYVVFHGNRAELDSFSQRLFTYQVTRTTFSFSNLDDSKKAEIIKNLDFMLTGTVNEINYPRGKHSMKARVPAYYKWSGNDLIIISGKSLSNERVELLRLVLESALPSKQKTLEVFDVKITGAYSGTFRSTISGESFIFNRDIDSKGAITCTFQLPLIIDSVLETKKFNSLYHAYDDKKLYAELALDDTLNQTNQKFEISFTSPYKLVLSIKNTVSYLSYSHSVEKDDELVFCTSISLKKLPRNFKVLLARNSLRATLSELPAQRFRIESNIAFSPWYSGEGFKAVDMLKQ